MEHLIDRMEKEYTVELQVGCLACRLWWSYACCGTGRGCHPHSCAMQLALRHCLHSRCRCSSCGACV